MIEWQPIETAPKDGTEILLWLRSPWERVKHAKWYDGWGLWINAEDPDPTDLDEIWGTGELVCTHWMPIPKGPQQ